MKLTRDNDVPDGEYVGVAADGRVIVRKTYAPVFARLVGTAEDEDLVVEWRTSPAGARRMMAVGLWMAGGAFTQGSC